VTPPLRCRRVRKTTAAYQCSRCTTIEGRKTGKKGGRTSQKPARDLQTKNGTKTLVESQGYASKREKHPTMKGMQNNPQLSKKKKKNDRSVFEEPRIVCWCISENETVLHRHSILSTIRLNESLKKIRAVGRKGNWGRISGLAKEKRDQKSNQGGIQRKKRSDRDIEKSNPRHDRVRSSRRSAIVARTR